MTRLFRSLHRPAAALLVTVALLVVPTMSATPAGALSTCTGRCVDITVPLPSGVKVTSNAVRLLLPAGYTTSTTVKYPVMYMLCGAGGNQTEWTVSSPLATFTASMKAIFVMPDCGGAAGRPGWYSDWYDGEFQWETYYIDVVMPYIASHYRVSGANGIAGLSMGGYGAVELAARHPGLFEAAGSFSGLPDIQYPGFSMVNAGIMPATIWGNEKVNATNWAAHNPTVLASKLAGVSLYLACGTGSTTTTDPAREERLSAIDHGPFLDALTAAGIPYHSDFFQGGEHTWPYFSAEAAWAIPLMLADLTR